MPRKMQIMMRAAAGTNFRKAHREDMPRDPNAISKRNKAQKAQKAAKADAAAAEAAAAPAPATARAAPAAVAAVSIPVVPACGHTKAESSRAAPKKPETAAAEAERKRADAHALGAALSARRQAQQKSTKQKICSDRKFG